MEAQEKVSRYIEQNNLLQANKKYLVALSGGADSVALLLILKELGYQIEAAHCNFKLRGEESDRDELFCKQLCKKNNIPFHLIHFDTTFYAELHKISIEMAARELRYGYFNNLCNDLQLNAVCVGHHINDNVETIFINLIRGTGLQGLTGIDPINGNIIRPFLCITREEIITYLESRKQQYIIDSSNLINNVTRNRIRLDLLPFMQTINPAVINNIAKTIDHLQEIRKIVDYNMQIASNNIVKHIVVDGRKQIIIEQKKLLETPAPQYTLFHFITPLGFSPTQIENILQNINNTPGKRWQSPTHTLIIDRANLIIEIPISEEEKNKTMNIVEVGNYCFHNRCRFICTENNIDKNFILFKDLHRIQLDAEKVMFPLTIRHIKNGDRFTPLGMKCTKLLSNYLTDRKKTWFDKQWQLVITDAQDHIVWVVNERIDNHFKITEKTKQYIEIEYQVNNTDHQ